MKIKLGGILMKGMAVCLIALLAGCYHGAVFTQYQRFGLQAKADPKTGVPIKASIGYSHGTAAVVPKEDIDCDPPAGEIGSMIAKNEIVATLPRIREVALAGEEQLAHWKTNEEKFQERLNAASALCGTNETAKGVIEALKPKKDDAKAEEAQKAFRYEMGKADADKDKQKLLHARSYFIGGAAAIVATVPEGRKVVIKHNADTTMAIEAKGPAAKRVAAAIKADVLPQEAISAAFYDLESLPEDVQPLAYTLAAEYIGADTLIYKDEEHKFLEVFNELKTEQGPEKAFLWLKNYYLGNALEGPKHRRWVEAQRAAYERYKPEEDCK